MARASRVPAPAAVPLIDLMPRAEVERRARAVLLRKWAWGVVAALAIVLVAVGATWWLRFTAELRLLTAQMTTTQLIDELASMSEVSQALAATRDLETFRTAAMASDLSFSDLTSEVTAALPNGVVLAGFTLYPGGVPQGADPAAEVGVQGTYVLYSETPMDLATTVRALRALPAVLEVDATQLEQTDEEEEGQPIVYAYQIAIAYDQTVYSGAFAPDEDGGR